MYKNGVGPPLHLMTIRWDYIHLSQGWVLSVQGHTHPMLPNDEVDVRGATIQFNNE